MAEAPSVISNWETLESAYAQETGNAGPAASIGWQNPNATSKWFTYGDAGSNSSYVLTATIKGNGFGDCTSGNVTSTYTTASDSTSHVKTGLPTKCQSYIPNF
jgi:hypothetical protein